MTENETKQGVDSKAPKLSVSDTGAVDLDEDDEELVENVATETKSNPKSAASPSKTLDYSPQEEPGDRAERVEESSTPEDVTEKKGGLWGLGSKLFSSVSSVASNWLDPRSWLEPKSIDATLTDTEATLACGSYSLTLCVEHVRFIWRKNASASDRQKYNLPPVISSEDDFALGIATKSKQIVGMRLEGCCLRMKKMPPQDVDEVILKGFNLLVNVDFLERVTASGNLTHSSLEAGEDQDDGTPCNSWKSVHVAMNERTPLELLVSEGLLKHLIIFSRLIDRETLHLSDQSRQLLSLRYQRKWWPYAIGRVLESIRDRNKRWRMTRDRLVEFRLIREEYVDSLRSLFTYPGRFDHSSQEGHPVNFLREKVRNEFGRTGGSVGDVDEAKVLGEETSDIPDELQQKLLRRPFRDS